MVWYQRIGNIKVEVCEKKEVSQGDISGVHIDEGKKVNIE